MPDTPSKKPGPQASAPPRTGTTQQALDPASALPDEPPTTEMAAPVPRVASTLLNEPSESATDTAREALSLPVREGRQQTLTDQSPVRPDQTMVEGDEAPAPPLLNEPSESSTAQLPTFALPSAQREVFGAPRPGRRTSGPRPVLPPEARPTQPGPLEDAPVEGEAVDVDKTRNFGAMRKTSVFNWAEERARRPALLVIAGGLLLTLVMAVLLAVVSFGGGPPPDDVALKPIGPGRPVAPRPPASDPKPKPPEPVRELFVEVPVDDGQGTLTVARRPAGELRLASEPSAEVFLGQRSLGRTPVTALVPAGAQELRFRDKALGLNKLKRVEVTPHQTKDLVFQFFQGDLRVVGPLGTQVRVDGAPLGTVTDQRVGSIFKIYEGEHLVETTVPRGKRESHQVEVHAWSEVSVKAEYPAPK